MDAVYICNECWTAYDSADEAGECELLDVEAGYQEWVASLTDEEFELWEAL